MDKEIRIGARVRNNRLYHAIFNSWPSIAAFCRDKGYFNSEISALINLKKSPLTKKGQYRKICRDLAKEFGIPAEYLFSPEIYSLERPATSTQAYVCEPPESLINSLQAETENGLNQPKEDQSLKILTEILDKLKPREAEILKMRFGLECQVHTYAEIAKKIGLSNARARQLTLRAISNARHKYRQLTGWYTKQLLSGKA